MNFCPKCAHPLETRNLDGHERQVCSSCGFVFYRNPAPATAALIVLDGKVVMVKRKYDPRKGLWTLPSGFIERLESPEACLLREVREETNLDVEIAGLFGVYSGNDDPRTPVVLIVYHARVTGGEMKAGDDALEIAAFGLDALPPIAFQAHTQILEDYRKSLSPS
jgi:ADP-ribose pyrophosphatase YjhB (NUDIX family)